MGHSLMADEGFVPKFDATKRKKKRTKKKTAAVVEEKPEESVDAPQAENQENVSPIASKSEEDHTYEELLARAFKLIADRNPNLVAKKGKTVLTIPEVFRSTKKTVWHNFQQTAKNMNRPPDHLLAFSLAELGTTGTFDGNRRLVVRGRFNPRQLENVQKNYISEYVTCRNCKGEDTILKKENRLYFIQCQTCGATKTVQAIRTGFVAQVTKRRKRV